MSDPKGTETPPAEAKAAAAPAPAEVKVPAAAPAVAPAPAPAKLIEKAAAAPAAAAPAAKPAVSVTTAPPPSPAGVGLTRAPAPPPVQGQLNITITAQAAALIMSGLVVLVLLLGGTTVFLLMRMTDRRPLAYVTDQPPGMDGSKTKPIAGHAATGGTAAANPIPEGAGGAAVAAPEEVEKVTIGENHLASDGKPSTLPGFWPSFRGPKFDNIVTEDVKLADKWPASGPPVFWSLDVGEGYAGVAVLKGKVYLLDYDEKKKEDALRCLSLEDGKEIWRLSYRIRIKMNHGISRTVPAVTDKYVVSIGPKCHVMCADAETGKFKWGIDLQKDYGTKEPLWYTAQCPIIDNNVAIIAPGGKDVLMMGVDCETGEVKWKVPNPKSWQMSHSSVIPMTIHGKKQYVYCALGGVVSVSAEEPGKILWETAEWAANVVAPAPVLMDDGHIFLTTGYGTGNMLIKIEPDFKVKVVYKQGVKEGVACEQQTPIYFNKHIFSMQPSDGGALKDQFVCMNPYDNGKVVWSSGKAKRFGHYEPFILADGKFYVLSEQGVLHVIRATPEKYEELASFKVLQGRDAWAPIALAGGRMILRDSKKMVCINVAKGIE